MDPETCRRLFGQASDARLATTGRTGPHIVPIVFALHGDLIVTAVDHKPKRTQRLQRIVNIERDSRVAVLADHYEDAWERLWWVRADGTASVFELGADREYALDGLADKYTQYRAARPSGPVVGIAVTRWTGWRASPDI